MSYKLPIAEELAELGFKSDFEKLNDVFEYTKEFVEYNYKKLIKVLLADFDLIAYSETINLEITDDPLIDELEDRIKRLRSGKIQKDDYQFVVHPVHKTSRKVIRNAWEKRRDKYALDAKLMLYYPTAFDLSPDEAIKQTLLNELYRKIIQNLPIDSFGKPPEYKSKHQDRIDHLERQLLLHNAYKSVNVSIQYVRIKAAIEAEKDDLYKEMFSRKTTQKQKANRLFFRILTNPHIQFVNQSTSLEDKELVIKQYLKLQSKEVKKIRNTRGRNVHKNKRDQIAAYWANNPDHSISQVAKTLKVDRKTARKHKPPTGDFCRLKMLIEQLI